MIHSLNKLKRFAKVCISVIVILILVLSTWFLSSNIAYAANTSTLKIGYSDANYFVRIFKESTGITPGKFRKQMKL